jgi:CRISPR-associated endoribonuclease Cas6
MVLYYKVIIVGGGECMRIGCKFECDELPVAYQMLFVSFIKTAIQKSDMDYYNKLYNFEDKSNKRAKNFCFSVYLSNYKIEGELININGEVILNISSPDYEFMTRLYNGILELKKSPELFKYKKNYCLKVTKIYIQQEKQVYKNSALFKTLSPIYIKDNNNCSLSPNDDSYIEHLNYIVNISLINYRGYGLKEALVIKSKSMKKVVVKESIRNFTKITGKKYMFVNAYKGMFELAGDIEDLNHIYQLGLSFKRGQGFGMLDLVD